MSWELLGLFYPICFLFLWLTNCSSCFWLKRLAFTRELQRSMKFMAFFSASLLCAQTKSFLTKYRLLSSLPQIHKRPAHPQWRIRIALLYHNPARHQHNRAQCVQALSMWSFPPFMEYQWVILGLYALGSIILETVHVKLGGCTSSSQPHIGWYGSIGA